MRALLTPRRPSPALLVALLALFVAFGGPAQAAKLINGKRIKKGTVTTTQIKDRGIGVRDLSAATLKSARYTLKGSITASKLAKSSVGSAAIAGGAVTSLQVADNSLLAQDLATGSVGSDEIADGAVRNADLASSAVSKGKLSGNSVGGSEVVDGNLSARDIGSFAGTAAVAVGALDPGGCQAVSTAAQPPLGGAQDMRDDVIVAGRPAALPPSLVLSAAADPNSATSFIVTVCNVAAKGATTPDPNAVAAASYVVPFVTINP